MMAQLLARLGYRVCVAPSGEMALAELDKQSIPLVIADLIMPGMDGVELCRRIKTFHPESLVYAFSGHLDLYPQQQLDRAGFDGHLEKPIDMGVLAREVAAAMERADAPERRR